MDKQNEINDSLEQEDKEHVDGKKENKDSRAKKILTTTILCISCLLNIYLCNVVLHSVCFNEGDFSQIQKLRLFKEIISNYYYEEIKDEALIEGSINGMIDAVDDKYTVYFNKDEMKKFLDSAEGKYSGVGISIIVEGDALGEIIDVYDNSPAKRAGLKAGDKILKVDGKEITNLQDKQDIADLIKGDLGQENFFIL